MTTQEKLIDSLGQTIFRLETNISVLRGRVINTTKPCDALFDDLQADLEKQKEIKTKLLQIEEDRRAEQLERYATRENFAV